MMPDVPHRIGDIYRDDPKYDMDATLKGAGVLSDRWRVGSLLVRKGAWYIGIVTDTNLNHKAVAKGLDASTPTVNAYDETPHQPGPNGSHDGRYLINEGAWHSSLRHH